MISMLLKIKIKLKEKKCRWGPPPLPKILKSSFIIQFLLRFFYEKFECWLKSKTKCKKYAYGGPSPTPSNLKIFIYYAISMKFCMKHLYLNFSRK